MTEVLSVRAGPTVAFGSSGSHVVGILRNGTQSCADYTDYSNIPPNDPVRIRTGCSGAAARPSKSVSVAAGMSRARFAP